MDPREAEKFYDKVAAASQSAQPVSRFLFKVYGDWRRTDKGNFFIQGRRREATGLRHPHEADRISEAYGDTNQMGGALSLKSETGLRVDMSESVYLGFEFVSMYAWVCSYYVRQRVRFHHWKWNPAEVIVSTFTIWINTLLSEGFQMRLQKFQFNHR